MTEDIKTLSATQNIGALAFMLFSTAKDGHIEQDTGAYSATNGNVPIMDILSFSAYLDASINKLLKTHNKNYKIFSSVVGNKSRGDKCPNLIGLFVRANEDEEPSYFTTETSLAVAKIVDKKIEAGDYGTMYEALKCRDKMRVIQSNEFIVKDDNYYRSTTLWISNNFDEWDSILEQALFTIRRCCRLALDSSLQRPLNTAEFRDEELNLAIYTALLNFESGNNKAKDSLANYD